MIHRFDTIDSTNTRAREMAAAGAPAGTTLIAAAQTGGRGRLGRSFHSPAGGLYISRILRPQCPPEQVMHLTCAAAAAACDAVEAAAGIRPGIKWTNDLVLGKRKLGGILTELGFRDGLVDFAVVGMGINVTQCAQDFPPELRDMAVSLAMAAETPVTPQMLEAALLPALDRLEDTLLTDKAAMLDAYRRDCITLGKEVCLLRGEEVRYGTALDIDDQGALVVRFQNGSVENVASGEVSVRGMYGYV